MDYSPTKIKLGKQVIQVATPIYCPKHANITTNIRCNKCDKIICSRCMIQTPVGARCKTCAQMQRSPIYDVSASMLARAIFASVIIGLAGGLSLILLHGLIIEYLIIHVILVGSIGYSIGEVISKVTNRKRGLLLQFVAIGGMLIVGLVTIITIRFISVPDLLALAIGVFVAVGRLR